MIQNTDITSFSTFAILDKLTVAGILIFNSQRKEMQDVKFLNFLVDFSKSKLSLKNSANIFFINNNDSIRINHFLKQKFEPVNQILLYKGGKIFQSVRLDKLYEEYINLTNKV